MCAASQRLPPPPPEHGAALERLWQFCRAGEGQRLGAAALGAANLAGVAYLGSLLGAPGAAYTLARNGLGFMVGLFPALQARARACCAAPSGLQGECTPASQPSAFCCGWSLVRSFGACKDVAAQPCAFRHECSLMWR